MEAQATRCNPSTLQALPQAGPAQKASSPFSQPYRPTCGPASLTWVTSSLPSPSLCSSQQSHLRNRPPTLPRLPWPRGHRQTPPLLSLLLEPPPRPGSEKQGLLCATVPLTLLTNELLPQALWSQSQGQGHTLRAPPALPAPASMAQGLGLCLLPWDGQSGACRAVVDPTSASLDAAGQGQRSEGAVHPSTSLPGDCWIESPAAPVWMAQPRGPMPLLCPPGSLSFSECD